MIRVILELLGGAFLTTYLLSTAIYLTQLVTEIRRFKPSKFREYVIILLISIGAIVPILNFVCVVKILKDKSYEG